MPTYQAEETYWHLDMVMIKDEEKEESLGIGIRDAAKYVAPEEVKRGWSEEEKYLEEEEEVN